ncbi:MAG: discoidin domain-containing protein [Desulfarculus sp.]|nr:discoidin domain-containing protein [Desulfarculus sp.]
MTAPAFSPPPPAAGPWPGRLAWLVLLLAAAVRAPHVIMPQLDADMAMWGVQALEIMQGRWHFLFSGELFGGNLEAWLAVPLFRLLGAGPEILALVPTLLSLVMVWLVWRLGRRELGEWGGLMSMAWAGLAPYYLILQCVEPKGGYIEVPLFTVLAFALTLRLLRGLRGGAGVGPASLALGLVWGLGLWCHLLMLPTILACGLFLLLHQPRILLGRHPWLMALGLLLGAWPLWVISLPAGLFSNDVLREGRQLQLGPAWNQLWQQGLPTILGIVPPHQLPWPGLWRPWRLLLWLAYGLACVGLLWGRRRQVFSRQAGPGSLIGLCLLFVAVYLAVWLFSGAYSQGTWRHLSPLYAALPFVFGGAVDLLGNRRRWPALACAGLLLGLHLWGAWQMTPLLRPGEWGHHQERRRQESELLARLERDGHRHVYAQWFWDALPLTLAARGAVTFADQTENHLPSLLRQADADPNPAYVYTTRAEDLAKSLTLAGISFRSSNIGRFTVFDRFGQLGPALEEVSPQGWQSPTPGAGDAWDRNLSTRWTPGVPQAPGQELVLDLGRVENGLCRLDLLPAHLYDAPQGLQVLLSEDGQAWRQAVKAHHGTLYPLAWSLDRPLILFQPARVRVSFPPQAARYIKLVQTGRAGSWWWSLAEVFVYRQASEQAPAAPPTPAQLAAAPELAQAQGPVLAPPEVLALLPAQARALERPQLPPKGGLHLRRLDLPTQPGLALCLPAVNWPASQAILAGRLAREPMVRPLGDWVIVSGLEWPPPTHQALPPPDHAQLFFSEGPALAVRALDNSPLVRWRSPGPQQAGQALRLELGQAMPIAGLVLTNEHWPGDQPRGLRVEISADGRDWREPEGLAIQSGKVIWGGDRLLLRDGYLRITFAPQPVAQARLTLTQSHPRQHWSIGHLRLLAPR